MKSPARRRLAVGLATAALSALLFAPSAARAAGQAGERVHACARPAGLLEPSELAAPLEGVPEPARRARLVARLVAHAEERLAPARRLLARGGAHEVRVLFGAGVACAWAPAALWEQVASLPEIVEVFEDPPREGWRLDDAGAGEDAGGPAPNVAPEPPLVSMGVPEAWALGYTGRGVLLAHVDTGLDFAHADLAPRVWTNEDEVPNNGIDDDSNGFVDDHRGWNFSSNDNDPQDLAGHGTNTAGLVASNGTEGAQIGVAPDVTLMVIRRGSTQSALWASSDYAIANGARIITQSASWKWSFTPDYAGWRRQADAELAAGMIRTNSGGNTGLDKDEWEPIPYNVATPANVPPPWHHPDQSPQAGLSSALGVGNVDARTLEIAPKSPYGPAEWTEIAAHVDPSYPYEMPPEYRDYPVWDGGPGLGKPDLVAPGEGSLTTALGGGYELFGGTSAATPRVAGVLALLAQAAPDATPAELTEALLTGARDLGEAGRDLRFGVGLPDVPAALDALGPPLRIVGVEVVDDAAPRGDGDGALDAGEIARVAITIENLGPTLLEGVELWLASEAPLAARDVFDALGSIPPGGQATSAPLALEVAAGSCGQRAFLPVELRAGDRSRSRRVALTIGRESDTTLLDTGFEESAGFTVEGSASAGAWVREAPVGTFVESAPANPGSDQSGASGARAWVTGNGATDPSADDVDGGETRLVSPAFDTGAFARVTLDFARWFFGSDAEDLDDLLVEARASSADPWTLVERVAASEARWRSRSIVVSDFVGTGPATRVRFVASDDGGEHVVEAGVDTLRLVGTSIACEPFELLPEDPLPALGASLRLAKLDPGHLELSWQPPASGAPAAGYRVTRSDLPESGFATLAEPLAERHVARDALGDRASAIRYYLVGARP